MIVLRSPLVGSGGTEAEALAALVDPDAEDRAYVAELYRLCQATGIDFRIAFAQWAHETANGTSERWRTNRNPAGLGISSDDEPDPAKLTGTQAAAAHVWALAYATGTLTDIQLPGKLVGFVNRWTAKYGDPRIPNVSRLGDLNIRYVDSSGQRQATWAWDADYGPALVVKANRIFKEATPMTDITFGKVPYPAVIESHLPASNPMVVEGGAPTIPESVFWHRMIGSWEGTNNWFHAGHAATAYGVSVQATDGEGGKIYEWIARGTGWYGESSGPAVAPYGDGAKLIDKVGVNSVNRVSKAIEISGNYDTPLDESARASIVALTAYFADQRKIPWDQFPIVPGEDRSFVIWHQEVTGPAYKVCPGAVVMNETSALIDRVAAVLKTHQAGGVIVKPPQYAESDLPDWWDESVKATYPGDNSYKGRKFYVVRRNYVATANTRRLSEPDGHAKPSGPLVKAGEKVHGERIVKGASEWVLTVDGHYIGAGRLSPRVKVTKE